MRSTHWVWDLVVSPSQDESVWGRDGVTSPGSSAPGDSRGVPPSVCCTACVGGTSGNNLEAPSDLNRPDDREVDDGGTVIACLSSAGGYSGRFLVRITATCTTPMPDLT